jgi:TIR domain
MPTKAPLIYVVYAAKDRDRVDELTREIESAGRARIPNFKIFFDRESLRLGSDGQSTILRYLADSTAAVVLLSPALFASQWVTKELTALFRRREAEPNFRIIPVMLEPTDPPGFLKGYQYVDGMKKDTREVATRIVDAVVGKPVEEKRFQPTGPAEYSERLQSIREAAARDEQAEVAEPKN